MPRINVNMGVTFDKSKFDAELNKVYSSVKVAPPVQFKTNVGKVDTGDAQKILDTIQKQASAVDSVVVKQGTWKNKVGETYTALTQMTVKWRDANGNVFTEVRKIENGVRELGKEYRKISEQKGEMPVARNVQQATKAYEQKLKSLQEMSRVGEDYAVRSEKWGAREQAATQQANKVLQEKIRIYKELLQAGKFSQLPQAEKEINAANAEMQKLISSSKYGAGAIRGWSDSITNAIKQTISYTFSLGALRLAQQTINQAIEYSIELNKEMLKIQVLQAEGAQTPEEINNLAKSYNNLAKEMGTTTLEVAKGSVEWLRQGKSVEETQTLLRSSTMLSKLGALESAEATEYLTSTLNSYGMEAEEAIGIVDRLIAVDNKSATSTKELATALRYSAASAKDAGVTIEQLISYIGVVSSTTRQNAESIGQAFKTIFARMQDIKAGAIDEDGLGINNVERALKRVDIPLRDTEESFRDMSSVLEELAGKWDTLTEVEQENIAKAIAGVRQQNLFRILMSNMGDALQLQEEQLNSSGLALDRYGMYLEGVEAHQNKVKASLEGLYQRSISSDFIIKVLEGVEALLKLIDRFGGLNSVLIITIGLFTALNASAIMLTTSNVIGWVYKLGSALVSLATGAMSASAALAALNLTAATGVGAAIIAFTALGLLLYNTAHQAENNIKKFEQLSDKAKESTNEFKRISNVKQDFMALWEEMETLRSKTQLTTEESKRLLEIYNQLNEISPGMIEGHYDENLNFIIDENALRQESLDYLTRELELKKQIALEDSKQAALAGEKVSRDNERRKERVIADINTYEKLLELNKTGDVNLTDKAVIDYTKRVSDAKQALNEIELQEIQHARNVLDVYKSLQSDEERLAYKSIMTSQVARDAIEKYETESLNRTREKTEEARNDIESDPITVKLETDDKEFTEEMEELRKSISDMQDIFHKANIGEILSPADVSLLEEWGIAYENTAQGIRITEEEYNKFIEAKARDLQATHDLSEAQNALVDEVVQGFGQFNQTQNAYQATYEGLSSSLWDYAQNTNFAFTTMEGQAITSADGIFAALTQSSASFQNIVSQMALQTGQTTISVMAQMANYAKAISSSLLGLAPTPVAPFSATGGGGGGGKSAEQQRLEKEISKLEKKKKALQDTLDEFKDYIKAQKEMLKLEKEEADFQEQLLDKQKSLAELKTEIALLALDDSEEAKAQRLKLEEEAANLEEEIAEDKEERIYQVKLDALDKAQADFEAKIDAQIDAIDNKIDKYKEEEKAIKSTGGAVGGVTSAVQNLGVMTQQVGAVIFEQLTKQFNLSERNKLSLQNEINKWVEKKGKIEEASWALWDYANLLVQVQALYDSAPDGGSHLGQGLSPDDRHEGGFAGDVKSNEVFHKLLKGEYVATEGQMSNFVKNILPTLMSQPLTSPTNGTNSVSVSMPINVSGNLDKTVLPDIEKIANKVVEVINSSLYNRGILRTTNITRI